MNIEKQTPRVMGTGEPFRGYKVKLNQAGAAAPTIDTAFDISLSQVAPSPALARTSAGVYTLTWSSGVLAGNVFINALIEQGATGVLVKAARTSATVITIGIFNDLGIAADLVGGLFLEIEVWAN